MSRARIIVILACILLVVLGATAVRNSSKKAQSSQQAGPGAPGGRGVPVLAEAVAVRNVPVYLRGLGSVTAFNTVTVKPRVDGQIT